VRLLVVNQEERSLIDGIEPHENASDLCDGLHGVTVADAREMLQQVLVDIRLLQQHNHVLKQQDMKLYRSLLDRQQAIVDEAEVCEVDGLELGRAVLVVAGTVEALLNRAQSANCKALVQRKCQLQSSTYSSAILTA